MTRKNAAARQLATDGSEHELGRTRPISVYLPPDMLAAARQQAQAEGRTLSNWVKWAVQAKLSER